MGRAAGKPDDQQPAKLAKLVGFAPHARVSPNRLGMRRVRVPSPRYRDNLDGICETK
ncbi:MAG: hypothetical protein JO166_20280 [Deltaproteobacteria bacterium]|nr:hypothetical protein [Deltaproteobacteria bacterium]